MNTNEQSPADTSNSQAGLAGVERIRNQQEVDSVMRVAAEVAAKASTKVEAVPSMPQGEPSPHMIEKVPDVSGADVLQMPARDTAVSSAEAQNTTDADVLPLQKPVITEADVPSPEQNTQDVAHQAAQLVTATQRVESEDAPKATQ